MVLVMIFVGLVVKNEKFDDFSMFCGMLGLWMKILNDVNCDLKLHG